jgi:hypothetical protein
VLTEIYDHVTLGSDDDPLNPHTGGPPGNEAADLEAKAAALRGAEDQRSGKTESRRFHRLALSGWLQCRRLSRENTPKSRSKLTRRIFKAPDKKVLRLYEGLPNPYDSILLGNMGRWANY